MFMFHVALSLCLLSLAAGSALYIFAGRCDVKGTCFARLVSIIIIIVSILSSLCTVYSGMKFAKHGEEQCPLCAHEQPMTDATNAAAVTTMNDKMDTAKKPAAKHSH